MAAWHYLFVRRNIQFVRTLFQTAPGTVLATITRSHEPELLIVEAGLPKRSNIVSTILYIIFLRHILLLPQERKIQQNAQ